ncbi:hypothetical protein LDENG_00239590 [Lucifuga dentata]|nr:hypothetical protein LDENG_00239590 [Lucifuga dentata]
MDSPAPRDDSPSKRKKKDSSTDTEDLEMTEVESQSMRNNLIFSGIPENPSSDDPEALLKDFMISKLKLPPDTSWLDNITFHCVHRLGGPKSKKPRPVITKLEHYKHKSSRARQGSLKDPTLG